MTKKEQQQAYRNKLRQARNEYIRLRANAVSIVLVGCEPADCERSNLRWAMRDLCELVASRKP